MYSKKTPVKKVPLPKTKPARFVKKEKDQTTLPPGHERLERAIAYQGLASRREAKELIKKGLVTVNGKIVKEPGFGIVPATDTILVANKTLAPKESVLVYKKRGIETTRTNPNNADLHSQFPQYKKLHPIGRLDKDSEGLIIMSNDGTLASALTKNDSRVPKQYLVRVRENVTDANLIRMTSGIVLDKVMTKPAILERVARSQFKITLFEGRKHQIRRMCDACHLTIESLIRIKIGHLVIGTMKESSIKKLSAKDIELLKQF